MKIDQGYVANGTGWELAVRRTLEAPAPAQPRPVLLVPGYGMNSFIFGFHPRGRSLEAHLAYRGFEVWSADLRAQGRSRWVSSQPRPTQHGLEDLALTDLPAVLGEVLRRTQTGATTVDVIGCSLGATLMFAQAAIGRDTRMGALVSFGGPLRWERVHPALRVAFASPWLAGVLPFHGTRKLAATALPLLARVPWALSPYLNVGVTDFSRANEMIETVEDPIPTINREIAVWIHAKDLTLRGVNLTAALRALTNPLLCVVASADGIVPRETVLSAREAMGSSVRDVLTVGDDKTAIAHADLFLCHDAVERVFDPLADWLAAR